MTLRQPAVISEIGAVRSMGPWPNVSKTGKKDALDRPPASPQKLCACNKQVPECGLSCGFYFGEDAWAPFTGDPARESWMLSLAIPSKIRRVIFSLKAAKAAPEGG